MSNILRRVINHTLLAISITVSSYVFLQMSNKVFIQIVISVTIAVYEILMQYIFATGKAFWKTQVTLKIIGAIVCFMLYAVYVFAYAVPSGMEFFAQQIEGHKTRLEATETEYGILSRQLKTNQDALDAYNLQMVTESQTGYGARSEKVTGEYNRLLQEQKELLERLREVSSKKSEMQNNLFYGLSKYLKPIIDVSPDTLLFIMFMALFLTIYLGLIFTSWDVALQSKVSNSSEKVSQTSKKVSEEFQKFVDASIRETMRVNSPQKVAEITGIPEGKCREYRAFLDKLGVIETGRGASRVKYPKDVVMKKVQRAL